jgi:hypothetical protein
MNYWDTLPVDIQIYIYKISLAKLIQKKWRQHPTIIAKNKAKYLLSLPYSVDVICPYTANVLEFCAKYSGKKSEFWTSFCMIVLDGLILNIWSSDMGHGWIQRCDNAHEILIKKYNITADYYDSILGEISMEHFSPESLMILQNILLPV